MTLLGCILLLGLTVLACVGTVAWTTRRQPTTTTTAGGTVVGQCRCPDCLEAVQPTQMVQVNHALHVVTRDTIGHEFTSACVCGPQLMLSPFGSSLERANFRDVDVRLIMRDDDYDTLARFVKIDRLNLSVSVWGNHVTGMPIDFQVQRMTEANAEFKGPRNALFYIEDPTYTDHQDVTG